MNLYGSRNNILLNKSCVPWFFYSLLTILFYSIPFRIHLLLHILLLYFYSSQFYFLTPPHYDVPNTIADAIFFYTMHTKSQKHKIYFKKKTQFLLQSHLRSFSKIFYHHAYFTILLSICHCVLRGKKKTSTVFHSQS